MTTPAPEHPPPRTDAGVTLRNRHLHARGPDGQTRRAAELHRLAAALDQQASYVTAAAQPRTRPETSSVAARTA